MVSMMVMVVILVMMLVVMMLVVDDEVDNDVGGYHVMMAIFTTIGYKYHKYHKTDWLK